MIDWKGRVRFIDNKAQVRVLCTDAPGGCPVIAHLENGSPVSFTLDGRAIVGGPVVLENIPERVTLGWVNVYADSFNGMTLGSPYATREKADVASAHALRECLSVAEIYRDEDGKLCIEEHEVEE